MASVKGVTIGSRPGAFASDIARRNSISAKVEDGVQDLRLTRVDVFPWRRRVIVVYAVSSPSPPVQKVEGHKRRDEHHYSSYNTSRDGSYICLLATVI